jgi:hypothetical protein
LSNTIQKHCIICGRVFEIKVLDESPLVEGFHGGPPGQSTSFCPICEARIRKEAGDTQKDPKPI